MAVRTFSQPVTHIDELRSIIGVPQPISVKKQISDLDRHCCAFIALSPFLLIGTSNGAGRCDVSPKGDSPGFVQVLDSETLLIPERPGNRRGDTLVNILENPHVGLLFMIPGIEDTLRVNGRATIVKDEELLDLTAHQGKRPVLTIAVHVQEAFLHCAKAFKRSNLWDADAQVPRNKLPSLAQMVLAHTNHEVCSLDELEDYIKQSYETRLY
ncbi:MAG: phosphohydrolase [SAR202 cluster bacterium Io17-Chloro-G7]|nr:MAG: phosphohydrolase [SAR202 cluster bacterium Io17-Chloro-G7]